MNEFILLVRNDIDHHAVLSSEQHQHFITKCEDYIDNLTKEGKLKSAQPLAGRGKLISGLKEAWKEEPFNENKEFIVGCYHIFAEALNDALIIAKGNPEFEYATTARIEIRPIMMRRESTGYFYHQAPN